jgi:hypothetical protein
MNNLRTPTKSTKKRSIESDHTSVEEDDGYDTDATVLDSPYDIEKQRELEREYNKKRFNRQNEEYERRQLLPDAVDSTVILDRKTDKPFYIKNSEGILEVVTSASIRNGNTFYNSDGQQITPEFLDFSREIGGKLRRIRRLRKKTRKSRKTKKSRKSRRVRKVRK